jgi:hypothetical protein
VFTFGLGFSVENGGGGVFSLSPIIASSLEQFHLFKLETALETSAKISGLFHLVNLESLKVLSHHTLANWTLIILFSEMLKFSKNYSSQIKNKYCEGS